MLKKFMVYVETGNDVVKIPICAKSKQDAKKQVEGNGEVIRIIDVSEEFSFNVNNISNALTEFSETEKTFIIRALEYVGFIE